MENKILEDLKSKLKGLQSKITSKNNKIEKKNEEIKNEKAEIELIETTRKGDNPKFEAFNEMVDEDIKNRNKNILKKEKEIEQEKENIAKIEEEKKTAIQNAKSEVKKDSTKKLVKINKLNNKVNGLKESARKVKEAKLATTDRTVYKVNDEEHKAKIAEIKKIYKEKNELYKEYQENKKALNEIEKIEEEVLGKTDKEKDVEPNKNKEEKATGIPVQEVPVQGVPVQEVPTQEVPEQETPEQEEPGQEEPVQETPEQEAPEQEAPEQEAPEQELYYVGLLNKIAAKEGKDPKMLFREINRIAQGIKVKPKVLLDSLAQEKGLIPLDIKEINVDEQKYTIRFGPLGIEREYWIGEENEQDELKIDLSRKGEAQFKETITEMFPSSEHCINKLDVGLMQIYINAGRRDLCQTYIDSINEEEKTGDLPKIEYQLYQAKGLSRNESVVRRNARNNEVVAAVKGMPENIFTKMFDSARNLGANVMAKIEKLAFRKEWQEEVLELQENMQLMLGEGNSQEIEDDNIRTALHSAEYTRATNEVSREYASENRDQSNTTQRSQGERVE